MIECVKLCINHSIKVHRLDPEGARICFKPGYNVIIGPNGSGKSTVLKALALCRMCMITGSHNDAIKYITTETLNPRVGGTFASREEMIQGIRTMFLSHGQAAVDNMLSQTHNNETVVLVDSPETGQDMEGCRLIYRGLLRMAEKYQVIVATNSLVFMRDGNLIDLGQESLERLVQATRQLAGNF